MNMGNKTTKACDADHKEKISFPKEKLLSSGLPLEYSVLKALADVGQNVPDPSEYRFSRTKENGQTDEFSVDLRLRCLSYHDDSLFLDLLVECKHRHDGVSWVFSPVDEGIMEVPFPQIGPARPVLSPTPSVLERSIESWPRCFKGVEVGCESSSAKGFVEGAYQLSFAALHVAIERLQSIAILPPSELSPAVILPALVTTATLRVLQPDARVEQVRGATSWDGITRAVPALLVRNIPCEDQRLDGVKLVDRNLTKTQKLRLSGSCKGGEVKDLLFWRRFTASYPTHLAVLSYSSLPTTLRQLLGRPIHEQLVGETQIGQG
ncbi:MAG: hypothetical protein GX465_18830 [Acidobacteria bacterium]|nr:hypothetical protein [Acidobacteriota bacterium]